MKKNKIIERGSVLILLITFILQIISNKVYATGNLESNYVLEFPTISIGTNPLIIPTGDNEIQLGFFRIEEFAQIEIDSNNLNVTSSNESVATVSKGEKGIVIIKGLTEGDSIIEATYTYQGKEYKAKETYTIYNKEDTPISSPMWGITLNKDALNMNVGDIQEIIVNANLTGSGDMIVQVIPEFDITWKIEDETIAKLEAIKNGIVSSSGGTPQSAEIKALKQGTTNLIVTVIPKLDIGKETNTFKVPITVTEVKEEEPEQKKENEVPVYDKENKIGENDTDPTKSKDRLPDTGENYILMFMIGISIILAIILSIKLLIK